jgi:outer membrane cobalamin receptor
MKIFPHILLIASFIIYAGCASSSTVTSERPGSSVHIHNPNLGLDEYLNRLSGVRVYGTGQYARVQIRGGSSFELPHTPLFVLDGIRLGRDFSSVYRMVDMNKVNSVRVLNTSRATFLYGHDGYAGAIEIVTEE